VVNLKKRFPIAKLEGKLARILSILERILYISSVLVVRLDESYAQKNKINLLALIDQNNNQINNKSITY